MIILSLDPAHRQQSPIAHLFHRHLFIADDINAPFHNDVLHVRQRVDLAVGVDKRFLWIRLRTAQQTGELIGAQPAADSAVADFFLNHFSDADQQLIARRHTQNIVDQFKILNIGAQHVIFLIRMRLQLLPHPPVKEFLTVKAGQPVIAELIDHRGVFAQVNDTGDAVQDNLRPVRFGDKIRRAVGKRRNLVGFVVVLRRHNDRNGSNRRIVFQNG